MTRRLINFREEVTSAVDPIYAIASCKPLAQILLTEPLSPHGLRAHAYAYRPTTGFRSVILMLAAAQQRSCSMPQRVCCRVHETASAASAAMQSLPEVLEIAVNALCDEESFLEMSFKGRIGPGMPWRQLTIRPVLLRGTRQIQVAVITDSMIIPAVSHNFSPPVVFFLL